MEEIEVKILDINREEVEAKLIKLGAKKILDAKLSSVLFDDKNKSIKSNNRLLRLRRFPDKIELTYKITKNHSSDDVKSKLKIAEETEIQVSDYDETVLILKHLGYKQTVWQEKYRISYKLGENRIEFDKNLGDNSFIPEYMEIEGKSYEGIMRLVLQLGFKEEDVKPWGFFAVREYYKVKFDRK